MPVGLDQSAPTLGPPEELAHGDFEMVVRRLADDLAFGTDTSLFTGSGLEYAQSRPYEPGDPVKQIDWRMLARTSRTYVKEYEALKRIDVNIVVDTSASMAVGSTRITKQALAIWLASAIGVLAQRRLSPCSVIGGGERRTRVEPSLLRSDLWRSIEPLRTGRTDEGTRIAERIRELVARSRRASVILVLSDLHEPDAIDAIREAAQRHDVVVLRLRDPAERDRLRAGFIRGREAETGRGFVGSGRTSWRKDAHGEDADEVGRRLARAGAGFLMLDVDRAVLPPLRQFLGTRAGTGGGRG